MFFHWTLCFNRRTSSQPYTQPELKLAVSTGSFLTCFIMLYTRIVDSKFCTEQSRVELSAH